MTRLRHLLEVLFFTLTSCFLVGCEKEETNLIEQENTNRQISQKEIATQTYLSRISGFFRSGETPPVITSFENLRNEKGDTIAYLANFNNNGFLLYTENKGKVTQ